MNNPFPTTRRELLCMFACYALTGLIAYMVLNPRAVAHFLIGV